MKWLFLFVFTLIGCGSSIAQTVYLVQPAGDGGFETGTTFAANGWSVVSPSTEFWHIGTVAPGYSGFRGAYWGTSTGNTYTISTDRTGHFYRDVVIPSTASNVVLSWSMKGNGESGYDRLLVYSAPTSVIPVANAPASPSTAISGATLLYVQSAFFSSYTSQSVTLTSVAGTTVRIIFTWQNDASVGTSPPVAIDNISLTYIPTICTGSPSAGTISPTATTGCSPYYSSLYITGASTGTGIAYQWQGSPDNSAWTDVSGAISSSYYAYVTASYYYRLKVTCTNSGLSSYSPSVNLLLAPALSITGTQNICIGALTSWSGTSSGGAWSSSNTAIATVSSGGLVTGISSGVATITYSLSGCYTTRAVTVVATPAAIIGPSTVCQAANIALSSATPGGTWSSSSPATALVTTTGIVSGLSPGTAVITYTLSGLCRTYKTVTVNEAPTAITGPSNICSGSDTNFIAGPAGGIWTSGNTFVATIGLTGVVNAIAPGVAAISYTFNGCLSTYTLTVNIQPSGIIGDPVVCQGGNVALSCSPLGGYWSSSNTAIATISGSGFVSGNSAGSVQIKYELPTGCYTTQTVTVNSSPAAITGTSTLCVGAMSTLSCSTTGGLWSAANPSVATIAGTGVVTGLNAGMTSVSYVMTNGCYQTFPVSVFNLPLPTISYTIYGPSLFVSPYSSYEWFRNGVSLPSSDINLIFPSAPGDYTVKVTDANGCKNTSPQYKVLPEWLSVNFSSGQPVCIYPNPVSSFLIIESKEDIVVALFNLDGKKVVELTNPTVVDMRQLANGTYLLNIYNRDRVMILSQKLVKED